MLIKFQFHFRLVFVLALDINFSGCGDVIVSQPNGNGFNIDAGFLAPCAERMPATVLIVTF